MAALWQAISCLIDHALRDLLERRGNLFRDRAVRNIPRPENARC